MGLKSKFSKMKSFLFDEEDDDKYEKKVKKNQFKTDRKILNNVEEDFSKTTEIEELSFDDVDTSSFDDTTDLRSRVEKVETEFKFPEFDDDDFMVERPRKEEIKPIIKEEPKVLLYQGSKRKEEMKKFKPTPMISPVFGLLDKDGNTVPKETKKSEYSIKDEVSFDDVRKKAYGSFEEELENTMKRLSKKTIEEAEKDMEQEEKLESERQKEVLVHEVEERTTVDEDDEDMILPNISFKEIDVDMERKKAESKKEEKNTLRKETYNKEDDDEDTKEQDLFNLLDSIYQKGDE